MKLIVGLGNPGAAYQRTRHNVGFEVLDRLARRFAPGAVAKSKFHGACIDTEIDGRRTLLLKPLTYMNNSGQSVAEAVNFYKIDIADNLLVLVDDLALECGVIRLRPEGSAGGHNGMIDIERRLGTAAYGRLRIGIDGPGEIPSREYVLGRFTPEQADRVESALESAVDAVRCWLSDGMVAAMNRFNEKKATNNT